MVEIIAEARVNGDHLQEFIEAVASLAAASRQEKGNISYHLVQDRDDPQKVLFIEQWEDWNAIEIHNETKHFMEAVPVLTALSVSDMIVKHYDILI